MVYLMTTTRCDEERDGDVAEEENESRTLLTRTGSGEESPQTSLNSVGTCICESIVKVLVFCPLHKSGFVYV